jgi:hypothetical protein
MVASFESQPHGGRAFTRHTRPDPDATKHRLVVAQHPPSGQSVRGRSYRSSSEAGLLMLPRQSDRSPSRYPRSGCRESRYRDREHPDRGMRLSTPRLGSRAERRFSCGGDGWRLGGIKPRATGSAVIRICRSSRAYRDASPTEPLPSTFGTAGVPAIEDASTRGYRALVPDTWRASRRRRGSAAGQWHVGDQSGLRAVSHMNSEVRRTPTPSR